MLYKQIHSLSISVDCRDLNVFWWLGCLSSHLRISLIFYKTLYLQDTWKHFVIPFIMLLQYSCLWEIYRPWQSQQSIEDELLLCHPVNHETECHKATCQRAVKRSSRLTKDWPGASVPLFVSNTLMRAVKLSNSLPLPSGTNNGTFNLADLSDINKHSHKENRRVPVLPCTDMFTNKWKRDDTHTDTTLNTHTVGGKEREADRDLFSLIMEHLVLTPVPPSAFRGQCCSVAVMVASSQRED